MVRFFVTCNNISGDKIVIKDKEQAHHIRDVLRMEQGEQVIVFDDKGNEYDCAIAGISGVIVLDIQAKRPARRATTSITVACAIPKKSKFDDIVDKLTQLGVDTVIPLLTERVIVKWDSRKRTAQQKRWEKIALSAAQQSQRNSLPVVEPARQIEEVLSDSGKFDLKLIPALTGERKTLKEIFVGSSPKNILVFIGPEGDFSPSEIELARRSGCIPVTLGEAVLRVETAAIAVTSFIRLYEER